MMCIGYLIWDPLFFIWPPYVAIHFSIGPACISFLFLCLPLWVILLWQEVYEDCVVSIYSIDTLVDLIELDILDFDMILGIDWLNSC